MEEKKSKSKKRSAQSYERLIEDGWNKVMSHESNPSQTWHRLRREIDEGIDDLTLLAKTLPNDKFEMVFRIKNIQELVQALLSLRTIENLEPRKASLAAKVAEIGLEYCKMHYSTIESNETLSEPILNEIQNTQIRCSAIAYKIEAQHANRH